MTREWFEEKEKGEGDIMGRLVGLMAFDRILFDSLKSGRSPNVHG